MRAASLGTMLLLCAATAGGCVGTDSGGGGSGASSGGTGAIGGNGGAAGIGGAGSGGSGGFSGVGGVGGSGGGGGGSGTCANAASRLLECGLSNGGPLTGCSEPANAAEQCESSCMLAASCTDLRALFCTGSFQGALDTCVAGCPAQGDFACGNGDTVPASFQCDGDLDCANGFDEAGCPPQDFTCDNGNVIPADWQCDDFDDCGDNSDEVGCPAPFMPICN